ncbi:MAG: phosphoglucosamine mutase [Candidatus Zixiibacteriota bacterium]
MPKQILMASTSGVRGIIGRGLDPILAGQYAAAFASMLRKGRVVVGRDSRPSGDLFCMAVKASLAAVGLDVIDIGIVPTPTVEIAVKELKASGGICITASHNPSQWNALKFFSDRGEFITAAQFKRLSKILEKGLFAFKPNDQLGQISSQTGWIERHIKKSIRAKGVNRNAIGRARFTVVVDAINGAGSQALPLLLERLGVKVIRLNCKGDGDFVHEPEPVAKNLTQLSRATRKHHADLGMACDPDADRLALVDEAGRPIGEELTLTITVQQVLTVTKGPVVVNLSTSNATTDVAAAMGARVYRSKVGEANVVEMMRKKRAVIGGEGNGGVIYPSFHAGRDSLIAAVLVLSALAREKLTLSKLAATIPSYYNIKTKASLPGDFPKRLRRFEREVRAMVGKCRIDRRDGCRFDFDEGWIQLRRSNTEPIYRLIVETKSRKMTEALAKNVASFFD